MEADIRKPIVLEFYGLPGSGKSTISHLVAQELRKQGRKVIEPTYDVDHKYSVGKRKAIKLIKLIEYALLYPEEFHRLRKLITENGYAGLNKLKQASNIAQKLMAYKTNKEDVVVFDEGLTQAAISLAQNRSNVVEIEKDLYKLCKAKNIRKIFVKVDLETAISRMEGRDKHDSRIETIENELERISALEEFEKQCDRIISEFVVNNRSLEESVYTVIMQMRETATVIET